MKFFFLIICFIVVDPAVRMSRMEKYWGADKTLEIENHILELVRILQRITSTTLNWSVL